jgi:hypothetical protein
MSCAGPRLAWHGYRVVTASIGTVIDMTPSAHQTSHHLLRETLLGVLRDSMQTRGL